ncbi:MAG: LysR family transcriptional regulator [Bacillales bacterium]|nr:LysR family transcriptional regulator [Bacillales bacterium]
MKIIQLQYFVEVVKSNNISKAAKKLYVSQPAISTSIKELEKEFNTTLFIRYNNQLTLTDEGHYLYVQAVKLLQEFDKVHDDMMSYVKKTEILKIGIPPMIGTFFVPKILDEFTKDHPHVEFQLIELASKANREAMLNQEISLGLTVKEKKEAFPDSLKYHKVVNTTLLFVVNKNHPLAKKKVIDIPDLDNVPLILMKEDALQSSLVQKAFEKNNTHLNIKLRTNQLYTIKELLNRNYLGAFIFNQLIEKEPNLVGIPLKHPIDLEIVIAWRKDIPLKDVSQDFLNYMLSYSLEG